MQDRGACKHIVTHTMSPECKTAQGWVWSRSVNCLLLYCTDQLRCNLTGEVNKHWSSCNTLLGRTPKLWLTKKNPSDQAALQIENTPARPPDDTGLSNDYCPLLRNCWEICQRQKSLPRSHIKPFLDLFISPWTLEEQPCTIHYPTNSIDLQINSIFSFLASC